MTGSRCATTTSRNIPVLKLQKTDKSYNRTKIPELQNRMESRRAERKRLKREVSKMSECIKVLSIVVIAVESFVDSRVFRPAGPIFLVDDRRRGQLDQPHRGQRRKLGLGVLRVVRVQPAEKKPRRRQTFRRCCR